MSTNQQDATFEKPTDDARERGASQYQYEVIDATTSFRLFYLLPGTGTQRLTCIIESVPWQETADSKRPSYEAISYTWGDRADRVKLDCNDGWVSIPSNLESALQQLRLPDKSRALWADSICINQADQEEKSLLVQRMDSVFSNASVVNMWLGPETDDVRGGLRSLGALMDLAVARADDPGMLFLKEQARWASGPKDNHCGILREGKVGWYQLVALMRRTYFFRTWIIQEVVLAKKAIMMCGSSYLEWYPVHTNMKWLWVHCGEEFPAIFYRIEYDLHGHLEASNCLRSFFNMLILTGMRKNLGMPTLFNLLEYTRHFECTYPWDRLFAVVNLLSLTRKVELDPLILPDYTKSDVQVFLDAARYIIFNEGNVDFITRANGVAGDRRSNLRQPRSTFLLPTWVPTLSFTGELGELQRKGSELFKAGKTSETVRKPSFSHGGRVLRLRGKMVGRVTKLTDGTMHGDGTDPSFLTGMGLVDTAFARHFRGCLDIALGTGWQPEKLRSAEVDRLVCALFRDLDELHTQPPEERLRSFWEHYDAYILPLMLGKSPAEAFASNRPPEISEMHTMFSYIVNTKFGRTAEGRFAVVPDNALEGDLVCVFEGATVPFLVRINSNGYWYVGEAYVEGVMYGEVWQDQRVPCRDIDLF